MEGGHEDVQGRHGGCGHGAVGDQRRDEQNHRLDGDNDAVGLRRTARLHQHGEQNH